jgi:UDP-N-acetylmuramoyl-tripeptide--D-alanyl-D-alanine ligase
MTSLTLADVIEGLTGKRIEASQIVSDIVIDSRQARPGSVFVALPGQHTDGHQFVNEALRKGAVAAIVGQSVAPADQLQTIVAGQASPDQLTAAVKDLPICIQTEDALSGLQQLASFWRSKFQPRVTGVTGSVGKSTTKELIWAVLSSRYNCLKNEGNYNNEIGLPLTLLKLNPSYEQVVLEMGMYTLGEIALLCEIARPQVGVVTNVEPVHLEQLGTMERIAQAKSELVEALPAGASVEAEPDQGGVAILNYDDPLVRAMAQATAARVFTYGLSTEADLWADEVTSAGLEGVRFVFHYRGESVHARVPLLGRHSVHTALRAALVGLVAGLDWADIISGLQSLPKSAQLRLVAVAGPNGSTLLDDTYNANPASTIAALNLLDDLAATKKIAILGDMMELGSFEEEGHRKVGCRAADIVDQLIVVGVRAKWIAEEARACGLNPALILELDDNQAAIDQLRQTLEPSNVVLIKGSNSQNMGVIVSALTMSDGSSSSRKDQQL